MTGVQPGRRIPPWLTSNVNCAAGIGASANAVAAPRARATKLTCLQRWMSPVRVVVIFIACRCGKSARCPGNGIRPSLWDGGLHFAAFPPQPPLAWGAARFRSNCDRSVAMLNGRRPQADPGSNVGVRQAPRYVLGPDRAAE